MKENDVTDATDATDATVEQGLLDNIQSALNSADPDSEYMDNTLTAVAAYRQFQDTLLVKAQRHILNL